MERMRWVLLFVLVGAIVAVAALLWPDDPERSAARTVQSSREGASAEAPRIRATTVNNGITGRVTRAGRPAADSEGSGDDAESEAGPGGEGRIPAGMTMDEIERRAILGALEQTGGNRTQAAEILGIGLRTLQRKLKEYKLAGQLD